MEAKESQFCVNCKVCVDQQKRYILTYVDNRVIALVSDWITPEIISDEDRICEKCYKTALNTVNKLTVPTSHTVKKLCLLCKKHLQTHPGFVILKENPSAVEEEMVEIVHRETHQKITPSDCLCFICFQKIKNKAIAVTKERKPTDEVVIEIKNEPSNEMDPLQIGLDVVKTEREDEISVETQSETDNAQVIDDEQENDDDDIQENDKNQESDDDDDIGENDKELDSDDDDDMQESDDEYNRQENKIKQANDRRQRYEKRQQSLNANPIPSGSRGVQSKRPKNRRIDDDIEIIEDPKDTVEIQDDDVQVVPNDEEEIVGTQNPSSSIPLPNYRRAPNSSNKCFFFKCTSKSRHTMGDEVRAVMLTKYKYYIPKHARVCFQHLSGDGWDTLYQKETLNDFSAEQIEHMLALVE